jgi:hypothetical protein
MSRNLFEEAKITVFPTAAGTIINGAAGGTTNGAPLGEFEYHSVFFTGTFANNGTLNVYACTNSAGSNPVIIRSLPIGSNGSAAIAVDVKSSAMGSLSMALGTQYTHLGAYGTVESGGTWRGALAIISTSPRVAPAGTTGLAAYGTYLV